MATKYKILEGGIHQRFLDLRDKIQVFGGGFGNGKTACACIKAIQLCLDYPGCTGLIARETYPKLNDTIRKEFYKWVPKGAVARWPTKDDNTLVFKNGSIVYFRYIAQRGKSAEDGTTTSNLLSMTLDWVIVDQIEDPQIKHKDFKDIMGRLRGSAPYVGNDPTMPMSGPRWFIVTANPTANWFYKKVIAPFKRFQSTGVVEPDLLYSKRHNKCLMGLVEGATHENSHNLDEDFIDGLESSYTGQMYDRFVLGKWAAYEGLVYPQFTAEVHMLPERAILDYIEREYAKGQRFTAIEGFDFGMVKPSCYLFGFVDTLGRVIVVDGFYKPTPDLDWAGPEINRIRSLYYGWINVENKLIADPAIFKRTVFKRGVGTSATTVAKVLQEDHDIHCTPGQNAIEAGVTKVSSYLNPHAMMSFIAEGKPGPLIYFNRKLSFIEDEFDAYFWKTDSEGERLDEPSDRNDHAMDTIKYMLSKRPEAMKFMYYQPAVKPEYLEWQEEPDHL